MRYKPDVSVHTSLTHLFPKIWPYIQHQCDSPQERKKSLFLSQYLGSPPSFFKVFFTKIYQEKSPGQNLHPFGVMQLLDTLGLFWLRKNLKFIDINILQHLPYAATVEGNEITPTSKTNAWQSLSPEVQRERNQDQNKQNCDYQRVISAQSVIMNKHLRNRGADESLQRLFSPEFKIKGIGINIKTQT